MSVDTSASAGLVARPSAALRSDRSDVGPVPTTPVVWTWPRRFAVLAALAVGFVLIGGGNLDLGPIESRLGLSAMEELGPFGQVFGGWEPAIWPAQLAPSLIWAWGEGGTPTSASVRWPAAIAGVAIGIILARRAAGSLGGRAGVLVGLTWFGSLGLIDRSAGAGLDLIMALGTVAALDRILGRGSDLIAGCWAACAFLAGGWPPVAVVALATVVIGRPGATLSWRLVLPSMLAATAWSAWALSVAPAEAWGAALALPLTQSPAWLLAPGVLALGLPWTPFAALCASRSVRAGWPEPGRLLVKGWLQVAGACLLAGTIVPGLALAARVPALAGLALAAAAGCDRLLASSVAHPKTVSVVARRWFFGSAALLALVWGAIVLLTGGYLAAAVSHYRAVAVVLSIVVVPTAALALIAVARRDARGALLAVVLVALCLKLAHWGYYVPEWNYRLSQGPWGRAIGQWVPPRWPIYTTHTWRADLAFATEHPVRQLVSPLQLQYQPGEAKFVLLLASEFENWPRNAPRLIEVARFHDEHDTTRVVARTPGDLPWTRATRADADD
jgi:hypothetical protein